MVWVGTAVVVMFVLCQKRYNMRILFCPFCGSNKIKECKIPILMEGFRTAEEPHFSCEVHGCFRVKESGLTALVW